MFRGKSKKKIQAAVGVGERSEPPAGGLAVRAEGVITNLHCARNTGTYLYMYSWNDRKLKVIRLL